MPSRIAVCLTTLLCAVTVFFAPVQLTAYADEQEAVKFEAGMYHTIKKGDTLWDLSARYFDSPWVWPELWAGNKQIANPHLIYPGNRIRIFLHETEHIAETITDESETATELTDGGAVDIGTAVTQAPIIEPPPEDDEVVDMTGDQGDQPPIRYNEIDHVSFIKDKPVTPHGVISKIGAGEDYQKMISTGDLVYIVRPEANKYLPWKDYQEESPQLNQGMLYTVCRILEKPIKTKKPKVYYGLQHDIKGVVEIMEINPNYAVGKVVESYRELRLDDVLIPYKRKDRDIAVKKPPKGVKGKVLLAVDHNALIGEWTLAFISVGKNHGVDRGQEYTLFKEEFLSKGVKGEVDVGTIFILLSEKRTSTVLVTRSIENILPGTLVRTPRRFR